MKIESTDQDVRNLLSSGYYQIPRFQRPYSWIRENIQDFWDDIIKDNPTDYFIGSMVVFKIGNQRYGVVDGQQRLTTITILLAVLRNTLSALKFEDLAKGIHGLIERRNIDNKPEFIVSTETSYPFLQDHILKWGEPELNIEPKQEEENIKSAFDQFLLLVNGAVQSIKADTTLKDNKRQNATRDKLIAIRDTILNLKVILVKLDEEDDAYIIFETLNTRGKDLSLSDLVKNHIMKHLKTKSASVDQVKVKWKKILEIIEGSSRDLSTDTFIHHFWLSKYDYLPAKNLFKELKRKITKTEARQFLDDLLSDSSIYRSIYETEYGKWIKEDRRIIDSLKALQLFRVQQQIPCVLSLVRAYKSRKIQKKHLESALVAIENFHFLFTAVTSQRSSGGISSMYASLGRRMFQAEDTNTTLPLIKELKQKLKERIPLLDEVKALFPEILYTESLTKQRGLMKYILVGFQKKATTGITFDYESLTIEHLIAQSRIGTGEYTEQIVGQAGNLILVSEQLQHKLKNKDFKEKKKILIEEGYLLSPEIKSADDWTPINIKDRTVAMATKAYSEIWSI